MIRQRAYFFDTPQTTAGDKFRSNNIPSETTFRDFLESIPFKSESADYASATVQGLVKLAADADSITRTGAGVIMTTQLPELAVNATPLTSGNASFQGIKVTAINQTTRLDYQVDLDPASLAIKATYLKDDYAIIEDTADSNKPKRILLSVLNGGAGGQIWLDTATVIRPVTAGDSLDMSGGAAGINADLFTLSAAADRYIYPLVYATHKGANLHLAGGAAYHASAPYNGGELYLHGGSGVNGGTNGNLMLAYDGSNPRGTIGVGGAVQSGYVLAITGGTYLNGKTYIAPRDIASDGGATVDTAMIYGNNGVIYKHTFKAFMDSVLGGAPGGQAILLYSGSVYSSILVGATKDVFLHTNASTGALEMALLDMTNRVTDSSVNATGITPAKIIGASGSNDVVAVFDKTSGALKLGTYVAANLGVAKTTAFAKVTVTTDYSGTPALLPSSIVGDSTAGEVDLSFPAANTVPDGTQVEVIQWSANVVKVIAAIRTGPATTSANYSLGGDQKGVMLYADNADNHWIIGRKF